MINLYFIRHGIADEPDRYGSDAERPLTDLGLKKTRRVAKRLKELDLSFDLILTSPLTRAKETTALLMDAKLSRSVELCDDLAPSGTIQNWVIWLRQWQQTGGTQLALVGHQPNLGQWAEWLCWGDYQDRLIVKKAGVIGVQIPPHTDPQGQGQLFWLAPPKFLL